MKTPSSILINQRQKYLKWPTFDYLELFLMILCGLILFGFSVTVIFDIVSRIFGHPWLWLQEVTQTLFIYGIFLGASVAVRRNDHLHLTSITESLKGKPRIFVEVLTRLVVLGVAICLVYFGYLNFLRGFTSYRMPSMTPIASLYAVIPVAGLFICLFTIEQLINGLRNGFQQAQHTLELFNDHPIQDKRFEELP